MSPLQQDRSILFLRVPKCGSTFVRSQMIDLLKGKKRPTHAIQDRTTVSWLDFRSPQIEELIPQKNVFLATEFFAPLGTTYNRYSPHWVPEQAKSEQEAAAMFKRFKDAGWYIFAFIRHPGDLLCSMYHYAVDAAKTNRWYFKHGDTVDRNFYYYNPDETLNQFASRDPLPIPKLYFPWKEIDYINLFSAENFSAFCNDELGLQAKGLATENKSSNLGYRHYCERGEISPEAQRRIEESNFAAVYREIATRGQVRPMLSTGMGLSGP